MNLLLSGVFFPGKLPLDIIMIRRKPGELAALSCERHQAGGGGMPKKVLWLIIIFTILCIIGANSGELGFLNNLANTV